MHKTHEETQTCIKRKLELPKYIRKKFQVKHEIRETAVTLTNRFACDIKSPIKFLTAEEIM